MPHKDWCGEKCSQCTKVCALDESIPCSPDCEELGEDGVPEGESCQECDAYKIY